MIWTPVDPNPSTWESANFYGDYIHVGYIHSGYFESSGNSILWTEVSPQTTPWT